MTWKDMTAAVLGTAMRTFGEELTFQPAAGGAVSIRGVFRSAFEAVTLEGAVITTEQPNVGVRLSDLPAVPAQGDQIVHGGVTYRVVDVRKDGEGGAALFLHRA